MSYIQELNYQLAKELKKAIHDETLRFSLVPQVDLKTGLSSCAEIKISWHSETFGNVPYERFVRAADLYGFLDELMTWAIQKVVTSLTEAKKENLRYALSLNVPLHGLTPTFVEAILTPIKNKAFDPSCLTLEWDEEDFWESWDDNKHLFIFLKKAGVRLCLNNFGLHEKSVLGLLLPIDHYKIQSIPFLKGGIDGYQVLRMLVENIHEFGKTAICNGIKTWHHYLWVKKLGIEEGQGDFFTQRFPFSLQTLQNLALLRFPKDLADKLT